MIKERTLFNSEPDCIPLECWNTSRGLRKKHWLILHIGLNINNNISTNQSSCSLFYKGKQQTLVIQSGPERLRYIRYTKTSATITMTTINTTAVAIM